MPSISSANAVLTIAVSGLYSSPVQIQQFGPDDMFDTENVVPVQTQMGADGVLSGGYTPVEQPQTITLAANSPSCAIFDNWKSSQDAIMDVYTASGSLLLPAIGLRYTMFTGYLTGYVPAPPGRRVLQPRRFRITWNNIFSVLVG